MPSVGVNSLSVVTAGTNGISIAFPDACKTPSPGGPVPIPYPNIAQSSDSAQTAKTVKAEGQPVCVKDSTFSKSAGDEAGTAGGVVSSKNMGKAEFVNYSFDVEIEGKSVPRSFDLMLHNDKNTPPVPLLQPPVIALAMSGQDSKEKPKCAVCEEGCD